MDRYDFVIVGSGLFGATFARLATDHGCRCLVIERRHATGGNIRCESVEGINVHKYGAHIFHTSDREVWNFVNSMVDFNRYTNCPIANYRGELYHLPFNMNTFHAMWGCVTPAEARAKLESQRAEAVAAMRGAGVVEPRNLEEQAILLVGRDIYEKLIKGYTEKQWGRRCTELPAFIIKRLPVRLTYDNNYFNDLYQGIPIGGYNVLIDRMLEGCDVLTDTDFFDNPERWRGMGRMLVFSGKIDRYFGYCYGKLQYRTVEFDTEVLPMCDYQGNAVINYTDAETLFTRVIEHKHFELFGDRVNDIPVTVVSREYSTEWDDSKEPFYPVNDERNMALYERYRQLAEREANTIFGGRLAQYRYYDMAPVIAEAMRLFRQCDTLGR